MLFFYFLCHLKKTDVIDQIESAIATVTLDMNTISKRQNKTNPSAIRMTYTASCLGKQDLSNGSL